MRAALSLALSHCVWLCLAPSLAASSLVASSLIGCASAPAPRTEVASVDGRVGTFVSTPRGFDTSSYWIEGPEGLVVIDTQFLPSEAQRLIRTAEAATGKRVVAAIVLHPNPDKFNGAEVFRRHGARVLTSAQVAARVPEVAALRRRWFYERYAPDYPAEDPTLEVFGEESSTLSLAGLSLRAYVLGEGCSGAHVAIEWEGHLFTGDLVAQGTHSWLELGRLEAWLERLDELQALRPRHVHPGRGASGGPELLEAERRYLLRVIELVDRSGPRLEPTAEEVRALRAEVEAAFPGYAYPVFLRVGMPAVIRARAARREAGQG